MVWNASHILWQEQLILVSILLPPIFITAILLALSAPRLFAAKRGDARKSDGGHQVPSHTASVSQQ